MKLSILLIPYIVAVDALTPFTSTRTKTRPFGLFAADDDTEQSTPFFLNSDNDKKTPTPPKTPPPKTMEPRPTISLTQLVNDETRENFERVGDALKKELVDPLLSGEFEKGVPKDAIKGAALTGVSLSLLAGQGLAITGAAGLGAAYVALSSGIGGKAVRSVGSAAWESAVAAAELYEKYNMSEKISQMTTRVVTQTIDALQQQGIRERLAAEEAARKQEEEERMAEEAQQEEQRLAELVEAQTKQKEQEARDEAIRKKQEAADKKKKEEETEQQAKLAAAAEAKQKEEEEIAAKEKAEAARKKEEETKRQAEIAAAAKAKQKEEEERVAKEKAEEKKRQAAAAAKAKQKEEEERAALEQKAEAARKEKEEETKRQAEIAAAEQKQKEQQKETERQAKLAEEYRIAAEKKQAAVKAAEEEAEKQRLAEKMKLEDKARLEEESRKRKEAQEQEEARLKSDFAVESDDDLEATIRLAEQILDGTIAGLDDAIADTDFKEEWDSAGRLARDLEGKGASTKQEDNDDIDDLSDEQDMEMLAQAAREAVAKFEEEMKNQDATKAKQKDLWDSEMVTGEDDFDYDEDLEELREEYDDEEEEDMEELQEDLEEDFGDVDLEELGRQARAAVEQFQAGANDDDIGKAAREAVAKFNAQEADTDDHSSMTDWSKFTVAQLKDELSSRDLQATGKKAELVARLTQDDFDSQVQEEETGEGVMWDSELVEEPTMEDLEAMQEEEPSLEDLAQAAREAVELFEQQELDDEDDDTASGDLEYETMTVNELKDELRNRGLKVSGKKADLIERLRSS